jgi:hypothetical protein
VNQQAGKFLMAVGERAQAFRSPAGSYAEFPASFDAVFADAGVAVLRSPPQAPRANAYAERWIRFAACLGRLLIVGGQAT